MMIKKSLAAFAIAAVFFTAAACSQASAEEQPVVLEMFVSQGCSSCPPANALMRKLDDQKRDDLLILTYGVTYWDYLGWKDTFGDPKFTERQHAYARSFRNKNVYTPQIVADGALEDVGSRERAVNGFITKRNAAHDSAPDIAADGEKITIGAGDAPDGGADVMLVRFQPGQISVDVSRGENSGRTYTAVNPVSSIEKLGVWTGAAQSYIAKLGEGAAAILVQTAGPGEILNAKRLN